MVIDIEKKRREIKRRYFSSKKHTIQVDFLLYMDELAELVGCKPQIGKVYLKIYSIFIIKKNFRFY